MLFPTAGATLLHYSENSLLTGLYYIMRNSSGATVDRALYDFIKIYHANEPLWNTKHPHYSKSQIRAACYDALVEKMQEVQPDATRDDVLRKINTIRSSFRKEYRKVVYSASVGKAYTPRLWYYKNLSFLTGSGSSKGDEVDEQYITPNSSQHMSAIENETETEENQPEPYHPAEEEDHFSYTRRAVHIESETVKRKTVKRKRESHAVIFGRHVSAKLEIVPRDQRVFLEKLINDAIFEAELGNLGRECRIVLE